MSLAAAPPEILGLICRNFCLPSVDIPKPGSGEIFPTDAELGLDSSFHPGISPLYNLCLTSKTLRSVALPYLYKNASVLVGSFSPHPLLVRTLVSRPDIAAYVRHLRLYFHHCPCIAFEGLELLDSERKALGDALIAALDEKHPKLLEIQASRYPLKEWPKFLRKAFTAASLFNVLFAVCKGLETVGTGKAACCQDMTGSSPRTPKTLVSVAIGSDTCEGDDAPLASWHIALLKATPGLRKHASDLSLFCRVPWDAFNNIEELEIDIAPVTVTTPDSPDRFREDLFRDPSWARLPRLRRLHIEYRCQYTDSLSNERARSDTKQLMRASLEFGSPLEELRLVLVGDFPSFDCVDESFRRMTTVRYLFLNACRYPNAGFVSCENMPDDVLRTRTVFEPDKASVSRLADNLPPALETLEIRAIYADVLLILERLAKEVLARRRRRIESLERVERIVVSIVRSSCEACARRNFNLAAVRASRALSAVGISLECAQHFMGFLKKSELINGVSELPPGPVCRLATSSHSPECP